MPHIEVTSPTLASKVVAILRKIGIARARKETRGVVNRLAQRVREEPSTLARIAAEIAPAANDRSSSTAIPEC